MWICFRGRLLKSVWFLVLAAEMRAWFRVLTSASLVFVRSVLGRVVFFAEELIPRMCILVAVGMLLRFMIRLVPVLNLISLSVSRQLVGVSALRVQQCMLGSSE